MPAGIKEKDGGGGGGEGVGGGGVKKGGGLVGNNRPFVLKTTILKIIQRPKKYLKSVCVDDLIRQKRQAPCNL